MHPIVGFFLALGTIGTAVRALAADGALDGTFGGGTGKVQLPSPDGYYGAWTPTGVGVQSTGKIIIAGSVDESFPECFVLRLNLDGSLDTTFGGVNHFPPGYSGFSSCIGGGIAVKSDDSIVAADTDSGFTMAYLSHYFANGTFDNAFGTFGGTVLLQPNGSDPAIELDQLALDSGGNIVAVGKYTHLDGSNDFYIVRATPNGKAYLSATYAFPATPLGNAAAHGVVIAADGTFYVSGNAQSNAGDFDCAVAHFYLHNGALLPDLTFININNTASITIADNYAGNNNDECPAIALQPPSGALVIGGRSMFSFSGATWNVATAVTQGTNGLSSSRTIFSFDYDQQFDAEGDVDRVRAIVIDPYANRPLLIGSGPNHPAAPATGNDIGVLRLSAPGTPDSSFGSSGYALYDIGSSPTSANTNAGIAATLWHGKLIVVGTAQDPLGGTDISAIRLATFDGIFNNGFD